MVDLHSHVLFEIDDGAESIEQSIEILRIAYDAGIRKMIATPHFTLGEDVEKMTDRRDRRLRALKDAMEHEGIEIELKAGFEVYITDELFNEEELHRLCLGDSDVLLAEFKYHGLKREVFIGYIDEFIKKGVKVLVAHPERYSYLINDPMLLDALLSRGVMLQVNGISLFEDSEEGDFARFLVERNLADVIGSDIHHPASRRLKAMKKLGEHPGRNVIRALNDTPDKIFEGRGV
ncbi:MAG: hypothetical protein IKU60_03240 [Clostridia bacterium]|nr:hypothetical protein [Clostridia bacterium]